MVYIILLVVYIHVYIYVITSWVVMLCQVTCFRQCAEKYVLKVRVHVPPWMVASILAISSIQVVKQHAALWEV
jgi:hypothetical protein